MENNILQISNPIEGGQNDNWVGNYIYFGNYPQSDTSGATKEPIRWQVLDNNNKAWTGGSSRSEAQANGFAYNTGSGDNKGGRQNAPVGGNGILLYSDKALDVKQYHPNHLNNNEATQLCWGGNGGGSGKGCTLWAWLNGYGNGDVLNSDNVPDSSFITNAFTIDEQAAIMKTKVYSEDVYSDRGYANSAKTSLTEDNIFIPSYNEMENTSYGFASTHGNSNTRSFGVTGYAQNFNVTFPYSWLRSPGFDAHFPTTQADACNLGSNYDIGICTYYVSGTFYVIPALNINPTSIILVSNAIAGKDSEISSTLGEFELPTGYNNEYKLTIKDASHKDFKVDEAPASLKMITGVKINVPIKYSNAQIGDNEYISAMLTQKIENGNYAYDETKYYGKIKKLIAGDDGETTITLKDIEPGEYTLKIFNEQCNGDKKTDWSSSTHDINLKVLKVNEFEVSPIAHRKDYEKEVKATLIGENFDIANKLVVEFVDEDGTTKLSHEAAINTGETEKMITFSANEMLNLSTGHYEIKAIFYDNDDVIGEVICKDVYHVVGKQTISDIERSPSFLQLPFDSATIKVKFKLNGLEEGDTIVDGAAIFMNAVGDEITSSQAIVPNGFQPDECLVNDLKLPRLEAGTYKIKGIMNFNHHDVISQSDEVEVDFEIRPEPTPEPTPTPTPTPTPSPSPTSSPAPTPTPSPTLSPSPTSMPTPSSSPTSSPAPIPTPSSSPIPTPTVMPTPVSPTSVPNPGEGSGGRFSWNVIDNNKIITPAPTPTKQIEKIETKTLRDIQKQVPQALKNIAYVVGNGNNTFKPDKNITRVEAAQMIYRLIYNGTRVNYDVLKKFSDVKQTDWYSTALAYLTDQDLIDGDGGKFYPNRQITRAEMSKILYNVLLKYDRDQGKKLVYGTNSFNFTDIANNWSFEPIKQLATNNMIDGYGDGTFKPNNNITRAESVTMISKVFDRSQDFSQRLSFKDVLQSHWAYKYIMNAVNGEN